MLRKCFYSKSKFWAESYAFTSTKLKVVQVVLLLRHLHVKCITPKLSNILATVIAKCIEMFLLLKVHRHMKDMTIDTSWTKFPSQISYQNKVINNCEQRRYAKCIKNAQPLLSISSVCQRSSLPCKNDLTYQQCLISNDDKPNHAPPPPLAAARAHTHTHNCCNPQWQN